MMTRVLRVPDEKFRDKVFKTMSENLTTFLRETGKIPANSDLAQALVKRYEPLLGKMTARELDAELADKADELFAEMHTPEWLLANDRRRPNAAQVKIAEGIFVVQKMLKTPGGLVRMTAVNRDGLLSDVHISGDFFFFPARILPELETTLQDVPCHPEAINQAVASFYTEHQVESPGVTPADFGQMFAN